MERKLNETTELILDTLEYKLVHKAMDRVREKTKSFMYPDITASNLYELSKDAGKAFTEVVPIGRKFYNRGDNKLYEFKYMRVHVDKQTYNVELKPCFREVRYE